MADDPPGLPVLKVCAILFALAVVGYFVVSGHQIANQTAVKVQVKLTAADTPDAGSRKPTASGDRAMSRPEPIFMPSSKVGVMFIDRNGGEDASGRMKLDTDPQSNRPNGGRNLPPPLKDLRPPLEKTSLPDSKTRELELPGLREDDAGTDAGRDGELK